MKLAKIYSYLKKDLAEIERALRQVIQADHPVLREASIQLLQAGGKRIRPVFVLLSGQFGTFDIERIKKVALSLELIHMATLVHDDVVDDAELRRGKPTIKHHYGNRVAMYTGDYILARALENITTIENPAIHQILSQTLVEVVEGEIEQIQGKYNWDQHIRDYFRRIKRKTALLIATSCKIGAIATGVSEKDAQKLYQYGYNIGMSFQIIDDILDFTATNKELGKPTGSDLLQGNVTLPVLFALRDPYFKKQLHETFYDANNISEESLSILLESLKKTKAIERSYDISEKYLTRALASLEGLPDHKAKQTLQDIASIIGKRRS
ncbi:heptaprenyl diphosphate synthase component II [Virgibacillus sp. W0430]|uniref:heptaprenyl diphosphate synthase component II n=1 Tax=Virgibacillus sp. W0430 TaxID=3391580 RepID=UPI003F451954